MKRTNYLLRPAALLTLTAALALSAHAQTVKYSSATGPGVTNKVRIEGTSTIHDWQVESSLIGGVAELGATFPTKPGQEVKPGPVESKVTVFIPVKALKSKKKDGSYYSDAMDGIMNEKLKEETCKRIGYSLKTLTLKESPKTADAPYVFEATGDLSVAGVTNVITMPVNVTPQADGRIQFAGSLKTKMTDFKIEPPCPTIGLGLIKTGDDITLLFNWTVKKALVAAQ